LEPPIHRYKTEASLEEVLKLYNHGIGVAGIAEKLGFTRGYMVSFFNKHGITQRNTKEQQIERMKYATAGQRKKMAERARNTFKGKKQSYEELCNHAIGRYKNQTLKAELETLDGRYPAAEVRQSVFLYIEAYYNRVRIHSALDYAAPNVFESGRVA
jgi:transposase InsO family protein